MIPQKLLDRHRSSGKRAGWARKIPEMEISDLFSRLIVYRSVPRWECFLVARWSYPGAGSRSFLSHLQLACGSFRYLDRTQKPKDSAVIPGFLSSCCKRLLLQNASYIPIPSTFFWPVREELLLRLLDRLEPSLRSQAGTVPSHPGITTKSPGRLKRASGSRHAFRIFDFWGLEAFLATLSH